MLPKEFKEQMEKILGGEYPSFEDALENGNAVRALRLNTLKIRSEVFESAVPFPVIKADCIENAYIFNEEKIGGDPLHTAGAYYVQDLSAMATVCSAEEYVPKNGKILDMCAAPGGKTAQLCEICSEGFVVSNEINLQRARILRSNIERLGIKNAAVTNCDTSFFAENRPEFFDFILVDAPCSGEGMLRKYSEEVLENWSMENIRRCAERQSEILENAHKALKPGGYLLYSTCTFNLTENEETIARFMEKHPEYKTVELKKDIQNITSPGIGGGMENCRRFYPHKAKGEGQFICLLFKEGEEAAARANKKRKEKSSFSDLTAQQLKAAEDFLNNNVEKINYKLRKHKDTVYIFPENGFVCEKAYLPAVPLGDIVKGRIVPHHHFFTAYGNSFIRKVEIGGEWEKIKAYLRGETFNASIDNGFCAVTVNGCTLGGGKAVDGVIKNHYPKGLREFV